MELNMQKERFLKAYKTLEFDKILEKVASCAQTPGAKQLCLELEATYDRDNVSRLQAETTDSRRLITYKGTPSFGSIRDVSEHVSRAEKGAVLTPKELLEIANIFRTCRGPIDYFKTDRNFETVQRSRRAYGN